MLNYLLYYVVILPISILPHPVLYFLSDCTYGLMFYLVGYRKKVVYSNLRNSFPDKSEKEIHQLAKKFYRHFCDLIVESIKMFTISQKQVKKRMVTVNPELPNRFYNEGKSILLVGGHYNSWEMFAVAVDDDIKHKSIAIYKELKNKFWDRVMKTSRSKYGLLMIDTKIVKKTFEENRNELTATIFATDQSPSSSKKAHWTTFLNQDTGVLYGTEKYAIEYNYVVLYGEIKKVKRGYYTVEYFVVCEDPSATSKGEITEKHTRMLEKTIIEAPQYWLWTHRRWKRKKPETLNDDGQ